VWIRFNWLRKVTGVFWGCIEYGTEPQNSITSEKYNEQESEWQVLKNSTSQVTLVNYEF
jgi:hypothetical protein